MQPDRTYQDLRQKHKVKIASWMFRAAREYYQKYGEMPGEEAVPALTDKIYEKIVSTCIWVPYDEVYRKFLSELPQYEILIKEGGRPEEMQSQKQTAPAAPKKKGGSKVCPKCGRKMKQQFIGLRHCKCGMSWKRGEGFFERSPDMVFVLKRRKSGKKTKQCPVIRF